MSTATAIPRSVKASFGEDLRRFGFEGNSFAVLEEIVRSIYDLKDKLVIKYQDDEKDWITLRSDQELEVAFQLASNGSLKITVLVESYGPLPLYPQIAPPIMPIDSSQVPSQVISSQIPVYSPHSGNCSPSAKHYRNFKKIEHLDKKFENLQKKSLKYGTARLVQHVTVPDGTVIPPNYDFVKTWRIRNESTTVWQPDFIIKFKKGDRLSNIECMHLPKAVNPGEEVDISIPMKTPSSFGRYLSVWRLSTGSHSNLFGQPFYVRVIVADPNGPLPVQCHEDANLETKMAELASMGFNDRDINEKLLKKCRGDMDKAVWKLLKKQQKLQFKQQKCLYRMEKNRRKAEFKVAAT